MAHEARTHDLVAGRPGDVRETRMRYEGSGGRSLSQPERVGQAKYRTQIRVVTDRNDPTPTTQGGLQIRQHFVNVVVVVEVSVQQNRGARIRVTRPTFDFREIVAAVFRRAIAVLELITVIPRVREPLDQPIAIPADR